VTLAAAAADSYIGVGLGMITLVALTAGTVVATLLVRRRDLFSVVISPPLVFVAVAVVNIGLAPSASLNAATMATLLIRGFPAMGVATAAAVLLALFRLVTRR
jgi:NADH:ubiquinone oxidoreductase subunit K